MNTAPRGTSLLLLAALFILPSLTGCSGHTAASERVVVYCALDREFAEELLKEFAQKTGLKVIPKFDTEATKSVSLFQDLIQEAAQPRCDVFWNNEVINTIRLQEKGVLEPYASPAGDAFPKQFRAADASWHAFAARARVILINTHKVAGPDRPTSLLDLTKPRWSGKVALAKPQFGTTATEAACLFQAWGSANASQFYRDLNANKVHLVSGNKQVAEGVGNGLFDAGLTDTDDAMAEIRAGKPVALVFPDAAAAKDSGRGTLFIPNTLGLVKNGPNSEGGKKLIDFLLSADVEAKLAKSNSCQIPLNPQVVVAMEPDMKPARTAMPLSVDFEQAAQLWGQVQGFLKVEFAK